MKPSAKRALSLLISIVLFVVALVIYALLIKPSYDEIAVLRGTLASKRDLFEEQDRAINKVNSLIQEYRGTSNLQEVVEMSLPTNENLSSVFGQLYAIARSNNMAIEVFGVQPLALKPTKKEALVRGLGTLRINLRLIGSFEVIRGFVREMETNIRLMDLVSLKMEAASPTIPNLFVYNLVVDAYYQPR